MNDKDWVKTLEEGEAVEEELLSVLKQVDEGSKRVDALSTHDIEIKTKTIEVKYDKMSDNTGNFAFEIWSDREFSGLTVCTADYYVMVTRYSYYFLETTKLKQFLGANKALLKTQMGGYNNLSCMILIPKRLILNQSFATPLSRANPNYKVLAYLVDKPS